LAEYGDAAEILDDLREWDYGDYEGHSTADTAARIRLEFVVLRCPNGETIAEVGVRAERVIARALETEGGVALFGHGHILRILTARWLGLPPDAGRLFALNKGR
jgi:probable phosphoglycerate mutase